MRRTQNFSSYVSMTIVLVTGVAFMVLLLTREGARQLLFNYIYAATGMNFVLVGVAGSILFLISFFFLLRLRFTV